MDEDSDLRKQIIVGVGVLLAVALLIGCVVAAVALKAADVTGITESHPRTTSTVPPKGLGPAEHTKPPTSHSPAATAGPTSASPSPTKPTRRKPPPRPISLAAAPRSAGTYERVRLTGSYTGGNGTTLQVQRKEGGSWADFPTSATVSGGDFSTYVATGRSGPNLFRVLDEGSGRGSNVVIVNIH